MKDGKVQLQWSNSGKKCQWQAPRKKMCSFIHFDGTFAPATATSYFHFHEFFTEGKSRASFWLAPCVFADVWITLVCWFISQFICSSFLCHMLRDSTPRFVCPSVGPSVGRLVTFLLFRRFWAFWAYGSCPDAPLTFSSTAPAHPHATRVAIYPALFTLHFYFDSNANIPLCG